MIKNVYWLKIAWASLGTWEGPGAATSVWSPLIRPCIRYIILVRGSKYGYNTGCETAYTKQHDKPGVRAWMLKTIIFTEKK